MSAEANRQLARHGYQMFIEGDIAGILNMCTDDIAWISSKSEHVPFSGEFHGKAGVADFFKTMAEAVEFREFQPQYFIAEGDKVAVSGIAKLKVRANGALYDDAWVHIFTMKNAKVARFEQYSNSAAAAAAFTAPQMANEEMAGAV